jgi:hypothetical protein
MTPEGEPWMQLTLDLGVVVTRAPEVLLMRRTAFSLSLAHFFVCTFVLTKGVFAADLAPEPSRDHRDPNAPQPAMLQNYDGAFLPLFDAYSVVGGSGTQHLQIQPTSPRLPGWWPSHFRRPR